MVTRQTAADPITRNLVFDRDLSRQLAAMKIPEAAVQILALAPLAYAAWTNGTPSAAKRELALKAAHLKGIATDSISYQLLEDWLCHRPDPTLITVWQDYLGALKWILSEESLNSLQQTTMERTRAVLRATSSCFGIGEFADNHQLVLSKIKSAFSQPLLDSRF